MAGTKRLTFDASEDFDRLLQETANAKSTTKADIIRRAVASYVYLGRETKDGKNVSITQDNKIEKDVVLP